MGLFSIFGGKPPEELERRGDMHFQAGAFGDAKMAFEKAIDRIERRFPEKKHLLSRIGDKHRLAKEALAKMHVESGDSMIAVEDYREAEAFYRLAMELTADETVSAQIREKMAQLKDMVAAAAEAETDWVADTSDQGFPDEEDDDDEADDLADDDEDDPDVDENGDFLDDDIAAGDEADGDEAVADVPEGLFQVLVNALPEDIQDAYLGYGEAFEAGYIALNHADFPKAVTKLTQALEAHESENTLIPIELATAYIHLNDSDRARTILEDFMKKNPKEIRGYQLLCEIFWESGNNADARNLLAGAPNDILTTRPMQLLLGEALFQAGCHDEAEALFLKCLQIHGKDEIVSRGLAKTYEAKGQIEKARDLYAEILNRCIMCGSAADPILKRRYADLCLKSGDKSPKLLELYFGLTKEDPDNRAVYFRQIADLYAAQGKGIEERKYRKLSTQAGGQNRS